MDVELTSWEVRGALRSAGARFAFLHGSRVTGRARHGADLDVAAWWGRPPERPWEIPLPAGVDLLVLDSAPLELAGRVALHGVLLFDDDPPCECAGRPGRGWPTSTRNGGAGGWPRCSWRRIAVVDEVRLIKLLQRVTDERAYLGERAGEDRAALRADVERLSGLGTAS